MKIFEYNGAKQVVVCGDIHGAFETMVFKACVQCGMTDTLIIVAGDCGFGFERPNHYINLYNGLAGRLKKANNWIVFVRGNHDDPSYFLEEKICYERFRCVPDYSVIQACGLDILCVGGGVSIDRLARQREAARYIKKETATYWDNEMPVFDEDKIKEISDYCLIDTVVTHTSPSFCPLLDKNGLRGWAAYDPQLLVDCDMERTTMDRIYQTLKEGGHPVNKWYYGHFHQKWTWKYENTDFKMLDIMEFATVRIADAALDLWGIKT